VITVHEPYRREILAVGTPANRVSVVMNSPDGELIRAVNSRDASPRSGFTLAYHGTLNDWYGVDLLVEAVALLQEKVPGVSALILGDGDALPSLRALAERLGVADRVHFSGRYLPIEDALARVRSASCGVIPNRPTELNRFALSSKLFEYVALEIPVVVARLDTLAAHFDDSEVSYFEPGSARSLAAAVEGVAYDSAAAVRRVERALHRSAEYSWDRNAARYLELLGGPRAPAVPSAA
jgi:glycosyltransferase involved in cell wall biosynthesis